MEICAIKGGGATPNGKCHFKFPFFLGILPFCMPLKGPRVKVQVLCDHWRLININRKLCNWIKVFHFIFYICWKPSLQNSNDIFKQKTWLSGCWVLYAICIVSKVLFHVFVHLCLQTPWFWIHMKKISCDVRCCLSIWKTKSHKE